MCLTSDTDSFWNSAEKEKGGKKTQHHIVKITESGTKVYQSMYPLSNTTSPESLGAHLSLLSVSVFPQPTTEESNFIPSLPRHQTLNYNRV